jgi:hypothetical protein
LLGPGLIMRVVGTGGQEITTPASVTDAWQAEVFT